MQYSVGFTITEEAQHAIGKIPATVWTPAYDGDGQVRDGAWVAELTGQRDLSGWPTGMRVIVRKERPHPGAQLPSAAAALGRRAARPRSRKLRLRLAARWPWSRSITTAISRPQSLAPG